MNSYQRRLEKQKSERDRIDHILALLKVYNPKNIKELKDLGIKFRRVGSGAYRKVYKLIGVPLVIKFPFANTTSNKAHTRAEVKAIKVVKRLKKFKPLRRYMPKIHYYHNRNGVVVMNQYYKLASYKKYKPLKYALADLLETITELIWPEAMKDGESVDIHPENLGVTEDGSVVFTDLGYFFPSGKGASDSW